MSLALCDVSVSYGSFLVVDGIDLSMQTNEWMAIIGPNGAGKSTLLKAVAGLIPFSGDIKVHGESQRAMKRKSLAQRVALVTQDPIIPVGMTITEYVLLGRTPHLTYLGSESQEDYEVARIAMEMLELLQLADRRIEDLSGGERQRTVLARALAQEPDVLLLDEPTSALDIGQRQSALELIGAIRGGRPMTIIAAMHDLTLAGLFADRLVLLSEGRLRADGRAAEVLTATNIRCFYGATVEVISVNDEIAVVPVRMETDRGFDHGEIPGG